MFKLVLAFICLSAGPVKLYAQQPTIRPIIAAIAADFRSPGSRIVIDQTSLAEAFGTTYTGTSADSFVVAEAEKSVAMRCAPCRFTEDHVQVLKFRSAKIDSLGAVIIVDRILNRGRETEKRLVAYRYEMRLGRKNGVWFVSDRTVQSVMP